MRLIVTAATAAAGLSLLVTACSTTSSGGSVPSARPTTATASPARTNPDAGLFTGTQLKAMLEPASYFPRGFASDSSGAVNTGNGLQPATPPGKLPCTRLGGTSWIDLSGIGSVSFAQSDFIDNAVVEEYAQEIDEFTGTGADVVMANLRKLAKTCPSFKDSQTGAKVTVKLGHGPSVGDDSLSFSLTSPNWQGGTTLVAIRVGTAVVSTLYSASSGTGAAQARALADKLAGHVMSKSLAAS